MWCVSELPKICETVICWFSEINNETWHISVGCFLLLEVKFTMIVVSHWAVLKLYMHLSGISCMYSFRCPLYIFQSFYTNGLILRVKTVTIWCLFLLIVSRSNVEFKNTSNVWDILAVFQNQQPCIQRIIYETSADETHCVW